MDARVTQRHKVPLVAPCLSAEPSLHHSGESTQAIS